MKASASAKELLAKVYASLRLYSGPNPGAHVYHLLRVHSEGDRSSERTALLSIAHVVGLHRFAEFKTTMGRADVLALIDKAIEAVTQE